MTRITFVMEQSLGNVTHYLNLRAAADTAPWMQPHWVPIDYRPTRVPWAVSGSWDAHRAAAATYADVDVAFFHTTTIGLLAPALRPRRPLVLSTDGAPNKPGMREHYNLKPEGRAEAWIKRGIYRTVFGRADRIVAWAEWTKSALCDDYGLDPARVEVIPPGVDVERFRVGPRNNELPRILFVGGDFVRKGGDLLLDVFRRRLRGRATLELVTKAEIAPEPGVTVHRGLTANSEALQALFTGSDLFALPTRGDMFSLAAMEALAAGLPLVATRVGGLPELVAEGKTGRLIDLDDADALGDALEELVTNETLRRRMSERARVDGNTRFDARKNAKRLFEFLRSTT